ncbi:hypothetical protein COT94_04320 [Candidatus Falkowbacteria bacterium CG10_big_fil_rev_8_21_14_0_10_37_14]|uniref:Nucleoid-associated protein, YbaB/EbfC family n=1 Tax=Candidatus Falkowbacteria bacterium CG10_big_fil_rev_8_21_14_0_10_37_14 TaxID=1974561 RepID=A0A2M6WSN7_9BACT|nr:YbaB/EbfC family nucleoid-associated protein [Candidatus Falkowbacteria bacterium]PIT95782.1 MAG: hypothetical protein COT94_04320 [Candidatus Falkowbacteria bacterium CG10_big_fil_rev_8_21_14_0_10_37_14]
MFNKLKQIKDLRNQAKTMQNALAEEIINVNHKGIALKINGNMEVLSISISEQAKNNLESNLKDCFNEAIKKTQIAMAKKMQSMGNMPGLSDLLK